MSEHSDVLVIGAGVAGLTVACALAQAGLSVQVLEAGEPPEALSDKPDMRVVAITRASEEVFRGLGVWEELPFDRQQFYTHMHLWDQTGVGELHFDAKEVKEPNLGHILEYATLQRGLWQAACKEPSLNIAYGHSAEALTITADAVRVGQYSASVLVAADGANSPIRHLLQIPVASREYAQSALVATIRTELPHQQTAYQRFAPDGPLAFLPLNDPYLSSIVWSTTPAEAKRLAALPEEEFNEALWLASDQRLGRCHAQSRRVTFPLAARHAKSYTAQRCALIGDAAHTVHPLAGQGLNLGILDAACLAQQLHWGYKARVDIGDPRVLSRYERRRRGHNTMMRHLMSAIKLGFQQTGPLPSGVRQWGMTGLSRSPWIKRQLAKFALGV
jgi:2-octaprenylphenol hydroxylase